MKYYDLNGDGNVSYEEFLSGLRDEMSARRVKMIEKIFQRMDRNGTGSIDIQDVFAIYDVSVNPEFMEHKKTKE